MWSSGGQQLSPNRKATTIVKLKRERREGKFCERGRVEEKEREPNDQVKMAISNKGWERETYILFALWQEYFISDTNIIVSSPMLGSDTWRTTNSVLTKAGHSFERRSMAFVTLCREASEQAQGFSDVPHWFAPLISRHRTACNTSQMLISILANPRLECGRTTLPLMSQ